MNTEKLQLALEDLLKQRAKITAELDDAIATLQTLLARQQDKNEISVPQVRQRSEKSYIDYAEEFLRVSSGPAHINAIVDYIRMARNDSSIRRAPIETGLLRHISTKGQAARLIKLGKGMYGLPQHSQRPLLTPNAQVTQ